MEKKILLALAFVLAFSAISVMPALATVHRPENITVFGNATANATKGNFSVDYRNTTQLNTSIKSDQYTWYRFWFRVEHQGHNKSTKNSTGAKILNINFTLPDTWVPNATTSVRLLNASGDQIAEAANTTYSEDGPDYGRVSFNLTNKTRSGVEDATCEGIIINNTSVLTVFEEFAIEYRVDKVDDHRSVVTTASGTARTFNVTYPAPSNVSLYNVTMYYNPSDWTSFDSIVKVDANGTTLTEGTSGNQYTRTTTGFKLITDWDFTNSTNTSYFKVDYTVLETGKGGTGAGATPPLALPPAPGAVGGMFWVYTAIIATIVTGVIVAGVYFLLL